LLRDEIALAKLELMKIEWARVDRGAYGGRSAVARSDLLRGTRVAYGIENTLVHGAEN